QDPQRLTPYEHICKVWTTQPNRFRLNPLHHTVGLNTYVKHDSERHCDRSLSACSFIAIRISSARLRAPMRSITQALWLSTVLWLMFNLTAISLLESPITARSTTCR